MMAGLCRRPDLSERSSTLDPFSFVIALVAIVTGGRLLGRIVSRREMRSEAPRVDHQELDALRASVDDVSDRLHRLEEERDFYRALLEAPKGDAEKDAPGASGP